ncbi:MAG: GlmU protein [Candidatus Cloacimonadota bacterium]|nr:MAG: GlmU protein [Candidatus Cloacimonadota bacterium]
MRDIGAVILAAGKGTRMKSEKPKVTFPLAGKPLVQRVVDTALKVGCSIISAVVGYKKDDVIACIYNDDRIKFVEQKEQKGTGHAVMTAEPSFKDFSGDIFILCGDVPLLTSDTLKKLRKFHTENKSACTILTAVMENPDKYGRIIRNEKGFVEKIVEFKDASEEQRKIREINTGVYCFDSEKLFEALGKTDNNNNQNEYYLTDTLEILNKANEKVCAIELTDLKEALGVNSQLHLADLEDVYYDSIRRHWLQNGVVIENPKSVIIGEDVKIENDTFIGANTVIKGKSVIGKYTVVGTNCFLEDANIEQNCRLKGYNIVVKKSLPANSELAFQEKSV